MAKAKKIPSHIIDVCKIGQKEKCCRYITFSAKNEFGWKCQKLGPFKEAFDEKQSEMVSKGDNCEGKTMVFLNPNVN